MADARLRELERRLRETGTVEDEAAWLAARLRAGELAWDALALEAYLGRPAAQRALGEEVQPIVFSAGRSGVRGPETLRFFDEPPEPPWTSKRPTGPRGERAAFQVWMRGFGAWGRELLARVLVAWSRVASPAPEAWASQARVAQSALEAWCQQPGDATLAGVRAARDSLERATRGGVTPEEAPSLFPARAAILGVLELHERDQGWLATVGRCSPIDGAALARALAAWSGPPPALRVPLPPGPTLRGRVEHAMTPPELRRLVAAINDEGPRVRLLLHDGAERDVQVAWFTFEELHLSHAYDRGAPAPASLVLPMREVRGVRPI